MTTTVTTAQMFAEDELKPEIPEYRVGQAKINVIDVKEVVNTRPSGFMSDYGALINPYQGCTFGCSYCYAAGTTSPAARPAPPTGATGSTSNITPQTASGPAGLA